MSNRLERTLEKAIGLLQQGRFAEAKPLAKELARKAPKHPLAWNLLGVIASEEENYEKAAECFRKATRLAPRDADFHNNLGEALRKAGRNEDALPCFQAALRLQPAHAAAHNNIGASLNALHREVEAADHLAKAIQLRPDNFEAYTNLGIALMNQRKPHDAVPCFEHAYRLNHDNPQLLTQLGQALEHDDRFEDAYDLYEKALASKGANTEVTLLKISNLDRRGRRDESWALLQPLLDAEPKHPGVAVQFSMAAKRHDRVPEALERLYAVLDEPDLPSTARSMVNFELGRTNDSLGNYDAAFEAYARANDLNELTYDHQRAADKQAATEKMYAPGWQSRFAQANHLSDRPVFVVGMPRSGTSLVEQIIDCHPLAHGAGELTWVGDAAREIAKEMTGEAVFPKGMDAVDSDLLDKHAHQFLDLLSEISEGAQRVTDKLPHNHLYLGLIEQLFPNARILHCKRDPIDTCLSCYFQNFYAGHAYSYDLTNLAKQYRLYDRAMAHWYSVSTLPIMEIQYEEMVADQERVSRRMIDFIGLEWDDACLRFHESSRRTLTASYDQVRQPIYRASLSRHQHYTKHIGPLIEALGEPGAADAA